MKFKFELINLKALDAVQIERIQIDTQQRLGSGLAFCLLRLEMTHRNTTEKSSGLRREW